MVLGEHVRFLEPTPGANGAFRILDPEKGTVSDEATAGASRDLFSYRIVGLFAKTPAEGKIARGAPKEQSRSGVMISLGNTIRSHISAKTGTGKNLVLALLALAYGVLHALGPGHQKTLVSGYLASEGGGLAAAVGASGIAAASHAFSVIVLFAILALLGSGLGVMDVTKAGNRVTLVSGILLVALALVMVCRRGAALIDAIRGANREKDRCGCGRDHCHDHGDRHQHDKPGAKKGAIPLLVSGSLSPCPGAALFLLYGFHAGNSLAGVVAVIAISLGMWLTLILVGLATVALRSAGIASCEHRGGRFSGCLPELFGVCGSCAVLAVAVLTVIPA